LRFFDIFLSLFGFVLVLPVLLISLLLAFRDTGSPIFRQQRVGRYQQLFTLVKIRTMNVGTQDLASHLVGESSVTNLGKFLRKTKLDELPQLWNVLKGEMSLVGPRPCLPNQQELIHEREARGVFNAKPGITGLAQINSIDMSNPKLLAEVDAEMISNLSIRNYFRFILMTVLGAGSGDRVKK
jgi:lipopolysaccharide/colanic/teichoic acid biosynthesis glycosyltransferase